MSKRGSRSDRDAFAQKIGHAAREASEDDFESESASDIGDVGELEVSEYLVFVFALDTYARYLSETQEPGLVDDLLRRGLRLLLMMESGMAQETSSFLKQSLPQPRHMMIDRAFRGRPSVDTAARRALQLRTVLSRGGAATQRAVFKTNKALQAIRTAIASSMMDDADAALDKFAAVPMRNARLRKWIDDAAEWAGSGTYQNPVAAATTEVADDNRVLFEAQVQQASAPLGSEAAAQVSAVREDTLASVQTQAQETARKALEVSGEEDTPPKKSEVVGIASAAVAAAMTDPDNSRNVPEPLRTLDPEQRAAAMTDGRVLVVAGAGSGKSTTLVSRVAYLVQERKVLPGRILACAFNKKAGDELQHKIANKIGAASAASVQTGTMHKLFRRFVVGDKETNGFGTAAERAMLVPPNMIADSIPGSRDRNIPPSTVSSTIQRIWKDCSPERLAAHYGFPVNWLKQPPSSKDANLRMSKWRGNDVGLEEAKAQVSSPAEALASIWYEMYLGLKGDIPNWHPPCQSRSFDNFMKKRRPQGQRLGDMNDMISVFRDILRRDSVARERVQGMFDHLCADEAQDLNLVQHQIFDMMSEHIKEGDGRSLWMVGDPKQCIYEFRGARPELFVELQGKEGWKTRMIRTNYRCEPEIVSAANRLIAHNEAGIPMEANANPAKATGNASIRVETPADNTSAAIDVVGRVRKDMDRAGAAPEDYAVLSRTNAELNDFETACIINEIPYMRKGGKGFLEAPEARAVLGYMDLARGSDFKRKRDSLIDVLMKPDRGLYMGRDQVEKIVTEVLDEIAYGQGVSVESVDPATLLSPKNAKTLALALKQPYAHTLKPYALQKRTEELEANLKELRSNIEGLSDRLKDDAATTHGMLKYILDEMPCTVHGWEPTRGAYKKVTTLSEQLTADIKMFGGEEDGGGDDEGAGAAEAEEAEDVSPGAGLGAVQFLFELSSPNASDTKEGLNPNVARDFFKKINRYHQKAATLKINEKAWEEEQKKLPPEQRVAKPPALTLSTVHKVKGAEWPNVYVLMPAGKFPLIPKRKPDEPPYTDDEIKALMESERNLAYVALTRAAKNLEVVCPDESVTPNSGGVSSFVFEAGLALGENVAKESESEGSEGLKTAAFPWLENDYGESMLEDDAYEGTEDRPIDAGQGVYDYGRGVS